MTDLKNKNILYITHSYKDWIKDPIELISREFNHVYVLVWHKPIADILDRFSNRYILDLERLIFKDTHKIYTKEYKFDLKNLPSNVTVLPVNLFYLPIQFWRDRIGDKHFKQVVKVINENNIKFDIIHSHIIWSAGYVGMKLKEIYKKPFIVTGHGRDVYQRPYESKVRMINTQNILKSADRVITVSKYMDKMIETISDITPVVVPNGFLSSKFGNVAENIRKDYGIKKSDKLLVSVGHLEPIKGYRYLIDALKDLITKDRSIKLILIGNGPDRNLLEKLAVEYNIQDNVIFAGIIPNDRISSFLNSADLFILPSLGEGNPTVMFESIACGLPFIGTRVGGIPEIINDDCGVVVDPRDVKGLRDAIIYGLHKKWNKEKIKKYAMQYEWNNIVPKVIEIYKSL